MARKGHKLKPELIARLRAGRMANLPPLEVRFWASVEKRGPTECWPWTGCLRNGYGAMSVNGRTLGAHRISLMLHGRELPPNRFVAVVDHTCRNRACVNPAHMRFVPQAVNAIENNDSPFAINKRKTHCKRHHEFTPENTQWRATGPQRRPGRMCIACYRLRRPKSPAPKPNRPEDIS